MGDTFAEGELDERPLRTLSLDAFYIGRHEVTNEEMRVVMQWAYDNGSITAHATEVRYVEDQHHEWALLFPNGEGSHIGFADGHFVVESGWEDHPCVQVTPFGALVYANFRSDIEGLPRCTSLTQWTCDLSQGGYRLPTEAEWEKAARGGLEARRFPWGDTITHDRANYWSWETYSYDVSTTRGWHPQFPETNPVGAFPPNGYGLHDVVGNVFEVCLDEYDSTWYGQDEIANLHYAYGNRVCRGGGSSSRAVDLRCASRPTICGVRQGRPLIGFRLAMTYVER